MRDKIVVIGIVLVVILFTAIFTLNENCNCEKISSTGISVTDENSLGAAVAFYLSTNYDLISFEKTSACKLNDIYHVKFSMSKDSNQSLYVDSNGDVYTCN